MRVCGKRPPASRRAMRTKSSQTKPDQVDVRKDQAQRSPVRDVPVEDALHIAHGRLGWRDEEGQPQAVAQQENGDRQPEESNRADWVRACQRRYDFTV